MFTHLRKRLAELDAQIVEQRRVLAELEKTRSDVEAELHATAYPVLTLPVEITTEIFLHCRQVFGRLCFPNDYEGTQLTDLASVCRTWREIALATPILWSELDVRFGGIFAARALGPGLVESCIDRWLTRAGNYSLSLHFKYYATAAFALSRLRDIIHRWSHQVQYLHLDINGRDIGQLGLDSTPFPLLQGVTLVYCDYNPDDHPSLSVFASAPRFYDLCLYKMYIPLGFSLPWLQLTKFEGALYDLSLFTLAPNLREAICSFDLDDGGSPVITHRNLRSLTTREREDSGTDILEYLTLPALQHLVVCYLPIHDSLVDFLSRSSPPLISLSFPGDKYGTPFNNWGRSLPSTLESLEIREASADGLVDPSILDALPNLRTLIFKDVAGGLDFEFLVEYLYSRSNQLRTFRLVWQNDPFFDAERYSGLSDDTRYDTISGHLSRLAQSGMDIYLGTRGKSYFPIGYVLSRGPPGDYSQFGPVVLQLGKKNCRAMLFHGAHSMQNLLFSSTELGTIEKRNILTLIADLSLSQQQARARLTRFNLGPTAFS